jgi:hypothetical protein
MKLVFFIQSGGLGNQIFQYSGIKNTFNEHKIILFGFSSFKNVFVINKTLFFLTGNSKTIKYIRLFLSYLLLLVSKKLNIITYAYEVNSQYKNDILLVNGFFSNMIYLDKSYFQKNKYIEIIKNEKLEIKSELLHLAKKKCEGFVEQDYCFLHIRGQDYRNWPTIENPAILPKSWYRECIKKIKLIRSSLKITCITDDITYAKEILEEYSDIQIMSNQEEIDFVIMCISNFGILSASTFSLSAILVSMQDGNKHYIAPKYWAGHSSKKWYPDEFITSPIANIEWL